MEKQANCQGWLHTFIEVVTKNLFLLIAKGMNHDIPDPKPFLALAEQLGVQEITPLEIIERLQETGFSIETHIGNEHMHLLLGRICDRLKALGVKCSFYVNALDTHLYVVGNKVAELSDIEHLLEGQQSH